MVSGVPRLDLDSISLSDGRRGRRDPASDHCHDLRDPNGLRVIANLPCSGRSVDGSSRRLHMGHVPNDPEPSDSDDHWEPNSPRPRRIPDLG